MKKRILAILLAATMLLSENSVVFAAEEIFNAPAQENVLDEMELENPKAASADTVEADELPEANSTEEDFAEPQPSDGEISWNDPDSLANDSEEPVISTNDMSEMTNPVTESANATETTEPQASADSEDITAHFKDPNFQAALREYLEEYEGLEENAPITKTVCKEIANLNVSNKGIKNLTGVEYLTNLFYLNCSNNQLTSLDLSKCTRLETLSCENNQLSSLNVSNCPDLSYFYCQNNQLPNLDLSKCTKLEQINCDNNKLSNLDMGKCSKLHTLDCGNNQLSSLDMSKCADLESLGCYNNQLTRLDISECIKLERLACSRNKFTTLELNDLPALDSLYCSDNSLTSIQLDCPALTMLDCSNNKLEKLPLDKCPALQDLSCFGNELTSLDVDDCPELKSLMCHANKITSLDITNCPALDSLNCAFNQLTKLNMECASLTMLECTDNKLTSLNISDCAKLQTLSCGRNQLSSLDVGKCPDLDQIFCRDNKLTKLDVSKCPNLIYIDCRENYMKSKADIIGRNSQLTENFFLFDPQKGAAAQTFTVTFDKNASKASLAANKRTKKVTQEKTYGALPTPTWSGYYFLGWYTAKSGGSKVTSGTKVSLKKNQTLYAHWVKADLTAAKINVKNCAWNGKSQKPSVTVTWRGITLKYNKDYTLTYSNNKNPGKGKVTVKGKGVFSRSKTKTAYFTISKASQTITAKNATYKASYKGKTIALKTSVKGGAKLTYASNKNNQIRVLNKNSSKLKLISPGAATITIKAAETKYYKAATKKVTVALQGTQSISLTSKLLSYNKTTKTYTLTREISDQSIGVSVKGGAKYACSVANSAQTSAWFGSGDRLTARGRGNITVTIQTEKTKDGVYPALRRSFTIYVNGFQLTNEWSYQQSNNGTLTLMKYLGAASEVTIPNTLILDMQTLAVTALGDGIFENEPVKKVTIQEGSVVTIGKAAFKNCASLSEIRLNSKTTSIGEEAFCGCSSLKNISLPEGLKTLPAGCLKGCSALEGDIYLPKSLTTLGASVFEDCGQIRNFIIHSFLSSVGDNAFKNCGNVRRVYFAGPQARWNGVRIGIGNEALSKICCNAGGASGAYSASNISTENLFYTYPNYLTNEGYDKITGNLEGEMLDVMARHTASEESAAALKSAMLNGPGYYLTAMMQYLTGTEYISERKTNRALALELLIEEAELSPAEDTALQEIYAVLEPYKKFGDQIFKNGDTRYQLAMKLDGLFAGRQASEINNMLKFVGEQKKWENISTVFNGLDNVNKATDFLMTFITLIKIGNDSLDRLRLRLPKDSGLYDGVEQLRVYLNQPLTTLIVDFIANKTLDKCVESFQQKIIVDSLDAVWKHKGYTGSSYVYAATMIYKLIGTMMDCPTIDNYNNAWLSIGNARVLRNQIQAVRQELVTAAQNGLCDENLKKDYDLLMRMYLFCLKKTGGYVASTMSDPATLNARMARYQDTLEYGSYLAACKSQI